MPLSSVTAVHTTLGSYCQSRDTCAGRTQQIYQRNDPDAPLCKFNVIIMFEPAVRICRRRVFFKFFCLRSCPRRSSECQNTSGMFPGIRDASACFETLIAFFNLLNLLTAKWFLWLAAVNLPTLVFIKTCTRIKLSNMSNEVSKEKKCPECSQKMRIKSAGGRT